MKSITLTAAMLFALSASAQSDFASIISSALDANPDLRAGELSIEAARTEAAADNTPAGPTLDFDYLWNNADGPNRWSVGVAQEFALPGVYSARSRAATAAADASRALLAGVRADKALAVKEAILDIVNAAMQREYYVEVGSRLEHIAAAVQRSYDLGEATVLDHRKMQLAVLDNKRIIADFDSRIDMLRASLEGMGATLPAPEDDLWIRYPLQKELEPSPDNDGLLYAISEAAAKAAAAGARALRAGALPELALGYTHAYEDGTHFNGFTIGLSLPSWGTSKKLRAAALEAEATATANSGTIISAVAESRGLYRKALKLRGIMDEYRRLSGDNTYLQLLSKAFDAGQLTVIDYLNEVNLFSSARLAFIETQYDYNLTLARLNRYRSADFE